MRLVIANLVVAAAIAVAARSPSSAMAEPAAAAGVVVEVELLTEKGFPFESTKAWLDVFVGLGIENVRIRAAQGGDETSIDKRGRADAPVYHVTGILAADGTLHVSGGRFKLEQKRRLSEWVKELAEHGPGGENKPKPAAFGLTEEQFGKLKGDLARKVGFSTKGARIGEVVARIATPLSHRLTIDGSATKALAGGDVVLDELSDVASGTALAAAVRPAGLIVVPRVRGDEVELVITSSAGAKELWPVGWTSETAPAKLLPAIIKATNVEIDETPLLDALAIVAKRLEAPVLFDHNNMARRDIDPTKASVTLPAERLTYSNVLKKLLYQARLKYELRVDEADKPLLWISPLP
ncbi:MAG: hypothetical protein WD875_00860 [Pirellulales bacterium]